MSTRHLGRALTLFGAIFLLGAAAAHASAISVSAVPQGAYGSNGVIDFGDTFTDYVNFNFSDAVSAREPAAPVAQAAAPERGTPAAAAPETNMWVMMLVGLFIVVYQLCRKQRSLEQAPAAGLIA